MHVRSVEVGDTDDDDDDAIGADELGKAVGVDDDVVGAIDGVTVGRPARSLILLTIFCIQPSRRRHAKNLSFRSLSLE
jgi:hypothetical protein